jgi:hypothetical protein
VVEAFRARRTPGVLWGDPTDLGEPRVQPDAAWNPRQGTVALDAAYRAHLARAGAPFAGDERFPLARPSGGKGDAWEAFAEETLGFVPAPSAPAAVQRAWREFLARRYPNVGAFNAAYALVGDAQLPSFEAAVLPDSVPPDGAPLLDWFQFWSVVLPIRRRAHRFTVLLPATSDEAAAQDMRDRAQRIVELQKPAHTVFEVRFYWAAFRLGEARLGEDTSISLGSRAPELLRPLVLGSQHLGETYLGGQPASDRIRREEPS